MKFTPIYLASLLFLSACQSTQLPALPDQNLPSNFIYQSSSHQTLTLDNEWWKSYYDENINRLVNLALENNLDLRLSVLTVEKALYNARLTDTNYLPTWSSNISSSLNKDLSSGASSKSSGMNLSLSYEVDLWGKLSATRSVKEWELSATQADLSAAKLSLIGSVIQLYYQSLYLKKSILITEQSITYYEKIYELTQIKKQYGKISALDELEANRSLVGQRASLTDLNQSLVENQNSLKLLLGNNPESDLALTLTELPVIDNEILFADLPAVILTNRPDMNAALFRLNSAFKNVEVTEKSYFPTLSLTSSVGTTSTELMSFFNNPALVLGAGLTLPFLNWNERKWNIKISQTDYETAVTNFRKTLLSSLEDVENNLSSYENQKQKLNYLNDNIITAQKAADINKIRYDNGKIEIKTWLDSQETLRQIQLNQALATYNVLLAKTKSYQALGGRYINNSH